MVEVTERIDVDAEAALTQGVRLVAGEPRVRHVYAEPGAAAVVLDTWRRRLADRAWVLAAEEAIDCGWFGPTVTDTVRARLGDIIVAMRGTAAVVRSAAEPFESALIGHHGSLTPAVQLVPLLLVRG
jgi:hypothetical protein